MLRSLSRVCTPSSTRIARRALNTCSITASSKSVLMFRLQRHQGFEPKLGELGRRKGLSYRRSLPQPGQIRQRRKTAKISVSTFFCLCLGLAGKFFLERPSLLKNLGEAALYELSDSGGFKIARQC
jgi:hypothetical protein